VSIRQFAYRRMCSCDWILLLILILGVGQYNGVVVMACLHGGIGGFPEHFGLLGFAGSSCIGWGVVVWGVSRLNLFPDKVPDGQLARSSSLVRCWGSLSPVLCSWCRVWGEGAVLVRGGLIIISHCLSAMGG